jgi:hypothetical protein
MSDQLHISPTMLAIGLAVAFLVRFVLLMAALIIMIKIQKLDLVWLPLIGSAFLASGLDLIPVVGHFIAVPVLYLCVWKFARCDSFKDATFTVVISYAIVRCSTWILAAYMTNDFHPNLARSQDNYDFTNFQATATAQMTNETAQIDPDASPEAKASDNKVNPNISVKGVSLGASGTLATIQCGRKIYTMSLGEGITASTKDGSLPVRFLAASANDVTLDVDGQTMKYAVK